MFCRFCGTEIPDDSVFCCKCGARLETEPSISEKHLSSSSAEVGETGAAVETIVFEYPVNTTYDQAKIKVDEFLTQNEVRIMASRFQMDAIMLVGTMMPTVQRIELDWIAEPQARHYQFGMMMDSKADFGLARKKGAAVIQKQFTKWKTDHPEYEIDGEYSEQMSIGWSSAWITCFFYR